MKVRGLFVTLCQAVPEVTGDCPLLASVLIDDRLVHVAFAEEREDLLLLALPADKGNQIVGTPPKLGLRDNTRLFYFFR